MAMCPNPPCPPAGVLEQARQQGAFGLDPSLAAAQPDAAAAQQPWQSLGNPHDDYEALLSIFQKGLALRRQGGNADSLVQQQLGHVGARKMSDLANILSVVAKQGGEDIPKPGAASSAGAAALDAASAGAGTQLHGLGQGVANLILGGAFKPGYQKGVGEYQQGMENMTAAHPVATTAGAVGGAVAGGLLLPSGAAMDLEGAAPFSVGRVMGQTGERSLAPGLMRGMGTGLAFGGGSGLLHQDITHPDWRQVAMDAAVGGGTGVALGGMRSAYDRLMNPAQFYLNRALSFDEPLIEESMSGKNPAGKPLLLESSPTLEANAQALARINRPAARMALKNVLAEQSKVGQAGDAIANDPKTGYDAIFENRWFTDPKTVQAWQDLTGDQTPSVSARDIFTKFKSLRRFVQNVSNVRMKGSAVVDPAMDEKAIDYTQKMNVFADALSTVPGFDDLQNQIAPYLQRRGALGRTAAMLNRRARGQLGEGPAKGPVEKLLQEAGYSTYEGNWRGAQDLLKVITSPNNARTVPELRTLLNPTTPFPFQVNRLPGSVPAAAGLLAGVPKDQ